MARKHRPNYFKDMYTRRKARFLAKGLTASGRVPRARVEPRIVISVKVPRSKKALWRELAGETALSRFIEEAVDSYVGDITEAAA